MADINLQQIEQVPGTMVTKYRDMGDGTHALHTSTDMEDRIGRLVGRITNYDVLVNGTLSAADETVELVGGGLGTAGLGISGT